MKPRTTSKSRFLQSPAAFVLLISSFAFQAEAAVVMSNSGGSTPSTGDSGIAVTSSGGALSGTIDYSDNGGGTSQSFTVGGSGTYQLNAVSFMADGDFGVDGANPYVNATWNLQIFRYDNDNSGGYAERTDGPTHSVSYLANPMNTAQQFMSLANFGSSPTAGDWITFSLDSVSALILEAGYTYGFSVSSNSGWAGFRVASADDYAGGERFSSWGGVTFNDNYVKQQSPTDHTFVVNLSAIPEPSVALLGGFGVLTILRRRRLQ